MDGAQLILMATRDLVNRNGPHEGYLKLTKSGDTVFAKWNGKITTTLSADDSPIMKVEGLSLLRKGQVSLRTSRGPASTAGSTFQKRFKREDYWNDYQT